MELAELISIHAPREGDDTTEKTSSSDLYISIHAPREGDDRRELRLRVLGSGISIHAPREGDDALLSHRS